ncbi:protein mono-ADP-ribosyltransferase PARP14-like isoform X2 [Octopus sinensis]|uniref:Poly [ADP-ribose] polymerase n=1 Tax=Octopus sinensis TaxID=2607531 RepID=A0A7E6FA13_9MOLL|nr:protein mono-ADP-ribosyltransferase PARP14-like isoform X2 [Octopus sinensis]
MEIFIENLRKDISSKEENFKMFGFQEFLKSGEGNTFLCEMQKKSESIILNSNLGSETEEILNFVYKNCEIVLKEGDITTLDTDAIVNAANGRLDHIDGVAAAIVKKGGSEIQAESNDIMEQRKNELEPGEVVSTKAGKLKCKTIIHAVGPVSNYGGTWEMFYLGIAVENCLVFLDLNSYISIAIPAINTGIYGIPIEEGTKCIVTTIKIYLDTHTNSKIKHICLIDVRKKVVSAFKRHLEMVFGISKSRGSTSSNTPFPGSQQEPSSMTPRTNVASGEYGRINIKPINDSITNAYLDVIVNSTNKILQLNDGSLSKSILNAAGPEIQYECNQKYPRGISTSTIAITKGHDLKCKNVFHLTLPEWDENSSDSILANLTQIMTICLENAERMGAKSLAFPILGAGALNYPIENLPETMFEAVKSYSNQNPSQIKDVYFVVYPKDTEIVKKFKEYFQEISADGSDDSDGSDGSHGSDVSSDHEDEEIDDNVSAGQQEDSVTLKFITNYRNLNHAIKTVGKEYNSQLTTKEIPFDMELKGFRKPNLKSIGTDHEVQISIRDKIKIHGRYSHVKNAKLDVQSLLLEYKEADEEILFKDIVQWSYFDENNPENIRMFSDKENAKLEKANSQKKKSLDWNNRRYDFQKMSFQHGGKNYKMKRKNLMDEAIPNTWSPMGDNELLKSVQITNGQEYDDIQAIFSQYLPSYHITKIERIQNKALYHGYQVLKRKYELENPNISNEVDSLWHGTAGGSIDGINKSGFNRSYCGKNATAFGEGVYFARDIQYSAQDKYSAPDANNTKRIYLCSVLVGKMMKGSHGLKVLQDSCNSAVDDIQNPTIYVIFHDNQAYPKYLIEFAQ